MNNRYEKKAEIVLRMVENERCVGTLYGKINSKHLSPVANKIMYKIIFRPILLHDSDPHNKSTI